MILQLVITHIAHRSLRSVHLGERDLQRLRCRGHVPRSKTAVLVAILQRVRNTSEDAS